MAFQPDLSTPAGRASAWSNSLLVDHAVFRALWSNLAEVVPGKLYRSNHPTPGRLASVARRLGLRTLINLRGQRACGSDVLSRDAAARLGLAHVDMAFESRGAPHRDRVLRLAEIYRAMREPALIHCKSGADRTGLAAGIWLLLQGRPPEAALAQLSLRFGHVRQGRTGILDAFFLLYAEAWKRDATPFLDWVRDGYDEAALRASFRARPWADLLVDRVLRRE